MDWPHAPIHRFGESGVYFVTAGTRQKQHFFTHPATLDFLQNTLFTEASKHRCSLQAWALFSNHYHVVVAADAGDDVRDMLHRFHVESATRLNEHDGVRERTVWYQFRDSQLTFERSWLARLRYTHENAVHHGLVRDATRYPWCSASWFANTARASFVKIVRSMKIDAVSVYDDYTTMPPQ
jgi:putative transposase